MGKYLSQGMIQKEKKESKYSMLFLGSRALFAPRISPAISIPDPVPPKRATEHHMPGSQREEKVQDMELELAPSPPPVEDVLAARRARRQAILAKYPDASSTADASGSSSAAQPPTKNSSFSDPLSQTQMVNVVGQSGPSKSPNLKEQQLDEELIR